MTEPVATQAVQTCVKCGHHGLVVNGECCAESRNAPGIKCGCKCEDLPRDEIASVSADGEAELPRCPFCNGTVTEYEIEQWPLVDFHCNECGCRFGWVQYTHEQARMFFRARVSQPAGEPSDGDWADNAAKDIIKGWLWHTKEHDQERARVSIQRYILQHAPAQPAGSPRTPQPVTVEDLLTAAIQSGGKPSDNELQNRRVQLRLINQKHQDWYKTVSDNNERTAAVLMMDDIRCLLQLVRNQAAQPSPDWLKDKEIERLTDERNQLAQLAQQGAGGVLGTFRTVEQLDGSVATFADIPSPTDEEVAQEIVVDVLGSHSANSITAHDLITRFSTALAEARRAQREEDAQLADSWEHEDKVNPARWIASAIRQQARRAQGTPTTDARRDLHEAVRQMVENVLFEFFTVDGDPEALTNRLTQFVSERERLRDERAVKLAEDTTLDYRFNAHYQGGFSMAQVRIVAAIRNDKPANGEQGEKEKT